MNQEQTILETRNIAVKIKDMKGWNGRASLYELKPPYLFEGDKEPSRFVVVSAASVMFSGPETYIFVSDESGEDVNFSEKEGSLRGTLDHEEALANIGYVASDDEEE